MKRSGFDRKRRRETPHHRAERSRARWVALIAGVLIAVLGASGCGGAIEPDPRDILCGRLVRFHRGLHHPVEVTGADRTPGKQGVRIAYRGTRRESSIEGTALCRQSDQTGELMVLGGTIDDKRLEEREVQAFNRFVQARKRVGG